MQEKLVILMLESKDSLEAKFLLPEETLVCFLLKPSTDWIRSTYIMESNLLYLNCIDLNVDII